MKENKKIFQKTSNSNKGITLVALVITIVILIILATVAINFAFGNNGLINRAEDAKKYYANDTAYTEEALSNVESYIDGIIGENGGSGPREVEGVTIPDGFYYVGGTKSEGIVISDKKEDLNKGTSHEVAKTLVGNQFVWVPVEDDSLFKRYDGYLNGELENNNEEMPGIFDACSEPYASGYSTEKSEYDAMEQSVLEHDGFYVGRYEAGTTNSERTKESGITDEVVIKQGQNVYNYVGWSNINNMINEKGGAVELSKGFAEAKGYTSVTSTLIYGVQWDAIMNFIDSAYATGSCAEDSFVRDSSGKGWYGQSVLTVTGLNEEYAVKNIYDLGGNVYEWTMEANDTNCRVVRGGNYNNSGSTFPASFRYVGPPSHSNGDLGFRPALYL